MFYFVFQIKFNYVNQVRRFYQECYIHEHIHFPHQSYKINLFNQSSQQYYNGMRKINKSMILISWCIILHFQIIGVKILSRTHSVAILTFVKWKIHEKVSLSLNSKHY